MQYACYFVQYLKLVMFCGLQLFIYLFIFKFGVCRWSAHCWVFGEENFAVEYKMNGKCEEIERNMSDWNVEVIMHDSE